MDETEKPYGIAPEPGKPTKASKQIPPPPKPKVKRVVIEEEEDEEEEIKPKESNSFPVWLIALCGSITGAALLGLVFWIGYKVGINHNPLMPIAELQKNLNKEDPPPDLFKLPNQKEKAPDPKPAVKDLPKAAPIAVQPQGKPNFVPGPDFKVMRGGPQDWIELIDGSERIRLWGFTKTDKHLVRKDSMVPILVMRCQFSVENLDPNKINEVRFDWGKEYRIGDKSPQIALTGLDEFKNQVDLFPWDLDLFDRAIHRLTPGETFKSILRSTELVPHAKELTVTITGKSGKSTVFGVDLYSLPRYTGN